MPADTFVVDACGVSIRVADSSGDVRKVPPAEMTTLLVTGASSFLGYHVVKRLNQSGLRPRVLERPGSDLAVLDRVDVERCAGSLGDQSVERSP